MNFRKQPSRLTVMAVALAAATSCDTSPKGRDAATPLQTRLSEVSVRVDLPAGGAPSLSVLAYRALVTGLATADVLGVVDPLVAAQPESVCELRDVAAAARAVRAHGGMVDLEEMGPLSLDLGANVPLVNLAPRVYPDYAGVVAGAVSEVGPIDVAALPEAIAIIARNARGDTHRFLRNLPDVPGLLDATGNPLPARLLWQGGDLVLGVTGPARTFVELRPFGATLALACPVGPQGRVVVPAEMFARLSQVSAQVPISFDAVWREARPADLGGRHTRFSLEMRASTVVELRH